MVQPFCEMRYLLFFDKFVSFGAKFFLSSDFYFVVYGTQNMSSINTHKQNHPNTPKERKLTVWRYLLFCGILVLFGSCDLVWKPPEVRTKEGVCSPWSQKGLVRILAAKNITQVMGCLVVSGTGASSSPALLTSNGELRGWNGSSFTAASPLKVAQVDAASGNKYSFYFYVPKEQSIPVSTLQNGLCKDVLEGRAYTCLLDKDKPCLFAIHFRPQSQGEVSAAPLSSPAELDKVDGAFCRLVFPHGLTPEPVKPGEEPNIPDASTPEEKTPEPATEKPVVEESVAEAPPTEKPVTELSPEEPPDVKVSLPKLTNVPGACPCTAPTMSARTRPTFPPLSQQGFGLVAISDDGTFMVTAVKNIGPAGGSKDIWLFKWDGSKKTFIYTKKTFTMSFNIYRIRFSKHNNHMAILGNDFIEIWDMDKTYAAQDGKPVRINVIKQKRPSFRHSDVRFFDAKTLLVGYYSQSQSGWLHLWNYSEKEVKTIDSIQSQSAQRLSLEQTQKYLFVGGHGLNKSAVDVAALQIFEITKPPKQGAMKLVKTMFLKQRGASAFAVVSPTNEYVAIGTIPQLGWYRGDVVGPPGGEPGWLGILPAQPIGQVQYITEKTISNGAVHVGATNDIIFTKGGQYILSLGLGDPKKFGAEGLLHAWQYQKGSSTQPFKHFKEVKAVTPAYRLAIREGCESVYQVSSGPSAMGVWDICGP